MAFCTKCGHKLPEGAKRCAKCGQSADSRASRGSGSLSSGLADQLRAEIAGDLGAGAMLTEDTALPTGAAGQPASPVPATPPTAPGLIHYRLEQGLLPQVKLATVFVYVGELDSEGAFVPKGSGSGFVIPGGLAITNRHVVQDASHVLVLFECGAPAADMRQAEVELSELPVDLALLRVAVPDHVPALGLGDSNAVTETDSVWALGYPLGLNLEIILNEAGYQLNENGPEVSVREGSITAVRHDSDGRVKLLEHNCNIAPGNSGGPLIDHRGLVGGVNTLGLGMASPAEVTNYAVPSRVVAEFLTAVGGPELL